MKIHVKTLAQLSYEIEAEEDETVENLKFKIGKITKNELQPDKISLIYAGFILQDGKILKDYKIDGKKLLVVMTKKLDTKTEISSDKSGDAVSSNQDLQKSSESEKYTKNCKKISLTESLTESQQIEAVIQNVVNDMGFSESDVRRAFRAGYDNPKLAIEYLLNGIPAAKRTINAAPQTENLDNLTATEMENNSAINLQPTARKIFDFLRNDPRFLEIRGLIQQRPELIDTVLQLIVQTNDPLMELLVQNQEELVEFLNEENADGIESLGGSNESVQIELNEQDREAIDRLQDLGFPERFCIEAYFACERNEEIAANLLCLQEALK